VASGVVEVAGELAVELAEEKIRDNGDAASVRQAERAFGRQRKDEVFAGVPAAVVKRAGWHGAVGKRRTREPVGTR
jgi:hypothetical protein